MFKDENNKKTDYEVNKKFIFSEEKPLDKKIWNSLTNNISDKKNPKIKLTEISESEQLECKRIIEHGINLVATHFERKICIQKMFKTLKGYNLKLQCPKTRYCSTCWSIQIDITNNEVTVQCKSLCDHRISAESSKFSLFTRNVLST